MKNTKQEKRQRRKIRIKSRITGTAARPRLQVFRSLKQNYAQLIDDVAGKTLFGVSDSMIKVQGNKTERAKLVGMEIAKRAQSKGIKSCVFDRNGYKYHGRIKALAEGARSGGLTF